MEPARAALDAARVAGNPTATAWALFCQGCAIVQATPGDALVLLEHARDVAEAVGNRYVRNEATRVIAVIRARQTTPGDALTMLLDTADDFRRDGYVFHAWRTLMAAGAVLARAGRTENAALIVGAARAAPLVGSALWTDALDRTERAIVAELGAPRARILIQHSAGLSPAQVIAVLRQDSTTAPAPT
jgi:hypothetical protein